MGGQVLARAPLPPPSPGRRAVCWLAGWLAAAGRPRRIIATHVTLILCPNGQGRWGGVAGGWVKGRGWPRRGRQAGRRLTGRGGEEGKGFAYESRGRACNAWAVSIEYWGHMRILA